VRTARVLATAVLIVCSAPAVGSAQERIDITALPACSAAQRERHRLVTTSMQGAWVSELEDHVIGAARAVKYNTLMGDNWFPADVVRHTLCGRLDHFKTTGPVPVFDPRERDWNILVEPTGTFAHVLDDLAETVSRRSSLVDCRQPVGGADRDCHCVEIEVTPDPGFADNRWFCSSERTSSRVGKAVCSYGPWVFEWAHGLRPEVHPAHLLWWRETAPNGWRQLLLLVRDASQRYDTDDDFDRKPGTGPGTPWSREGRSVELRVAFETPLGAANAAILTVATPVPSCGVAATSSTLWPELVDGDRTLLSVVGESGVLDIVSVAFEELCTDAGTVLGWLAIRSELEESARSRPCSAGFLALDLTLGQAPEPDPDTCSRRAVVQPFLEPGSLRFDLTGELPLLRGDLALGLPLPWATSPEELAAWARDPSSPLEITAMAGPPPLAHELRPAAADLPHRLVIKNADLTTGMTLELRGGGRSGVAPLPDLGFVSLPIAFVPLMKDSEVSEATIGGPDSAQRIEQLLRYAGVELGRAAATELMVERAAETTVNVRWMPAAVRDGEAMPEDLPDRLIDELLRGVADAAPEMAARFGAMADGSAWQWDFDGRNLATGGAAEVHDGAAGPPEAIVVRPLAGCGTEPTESCLVVRWPTLRRPPHAVYALRATARLRGPVGSPQEDEVVLFSDSLRLGPGDAVERELPALLEAATGLDADWLRRAWVLDGVADDVFDALARAPERRARLLRLYAGWAARDRRLDGQELRALVGLARRTRGR